MYHYILIASQVLEELYKQELKRKPIDRATLQSNVSSLFHHLYREQTKSKREACDELSEQVITKVSIVALSFINLWIDYHGALAHKSFQERLCKLMTDAADMGKVSLLVAKALKDHFLYLTDANVSCKVD